MAGPGNAMAVEPMSPCGAATKDRVAQSINNGGYLVDIKWPVTDVIN